MKIGLISRILYLILLFIIFSFFSTNFTKADNLVSYIDVKFCNGNLTKDLSFQILPGIEKEICVQIENKQNIPLNVKMDFVQGIITSDQYKNKACDVTVGGFGGYVDKSRGDKLVFIDAKSIVKKTAKIKFPIGINGIQHGCLVYNVVNTNQNSNEIFDVIVRKANFIDVFVDDEINFENIVELKDISSQSLSNNKKIRAYLDLLNNLILEFTVVNNSIVDEKISVTGNISDFFGFYKDFNADKKIIYTNSESTFNINVGQLPDYKGLFKVNFNLSYKPDFNFSNNNSINETIKNGGIINEKFSITIIPWKIILGIFIFIVFVKFLFRSGKKYRQKNP